ncbi:MAG: VOC family protein [Acidimicrobiia bacterium]|nr:VOC family protein [Acidimicrobiia bacterium]
MFEQPDVVSFHHVRLPVSHVLVSRDWYIDVLGFGPMLVEELEDRVTGVALSHRSGVVLGLHEEPERARALRGFVLVALSVPDISEWADYLQYRGSHAVPAESHLGRCLQIADPDGILIQLHTAAQPSADEA